MTDVPGFFKIRSSYKPTGRIENFVGDAKGDLFYDFDNRQIRISDGETPGGIAIGGGGDFSGNYNDLSNTPVLFSGSYNDLSDTPTNIKTVQLFQDGTLQVVTGTVRWYNPGALTIDKITARLSIAADDIVTLLIKKNDRTVKTITIPAAETKVILNNAQITMSVDDYLTVDVTTVGNTDKGNGLSVEFFYTLE